MNDENLTPIQREVESALGSLAAAGPTRSFDQIAFECGRAAERTRARRWRTAAGALALLQTVTLSLWGASLGAGADNGVPRTRSDDNVAAVSAGVQPEPTLTPDPIALPSRGSAYLLTRADVLRNGVDSLRIRGGSASAQQRSSRGDPELRDILPPRTPVAPSGAEGAWWNRLILVGGA